MGKIKATRKYENPIEFIETHKLWMDTNRKPLIRDADDRATFNRLHPIPFTVRIPKESIDRELPAKLLREAEGILAWAVAGAQLWHETGLNKPTEVEAAKNEWQSEMDQLGRFIAEQCITDSTLRTPASRLYAGYKAWGEAGGEKELMSSTAFGRKLPERGFSKQGTSRGNVYLGIGLRPEEETSGGGEFGRGG
jgi:putative DNA primase/helicase